MSGHVGKEARDDMRRERLRVRQLPRAEVALHVRERLQVRLRVHTAELFIRCRLKVGVEYHTGLLNEALADRVEARWPFLVRWGSKQR